MTPQVGVAFVVREKFSWALASLKRLYAIAGAPFTLYFVDSVYPQPYRAEIDAFLADKANVVRVPAPRFLFPNEAFNLAVEYLREPCLWFLQNDVLIAPHSLAYKLETLEALGCDAVAPATFDMEQGGPEIHRDTAKPLGIVEEGDRIFVDRPWAPEVHGGRTRLLHFELHSLLMTAEAARASAPLPPISSREHIDLALRFWRAGRRVYLDERARGVFMGSPPLQLREFDLPFYQFRWDIIRARQSHEYVRNRWGLADMRSAMVFVHGLQAALEPQTIKRGAAAVSAIDPWPEELLA